MGFCPTPTPEMGEYSVEIRRESFCIGSEVDNDNRFNCTACGHNRVEILLADIPKIRAALDQVEAHVNGSPAPLKSNDKPDERLARLFLLMDRAQQAPGRADPVLCHEYLLLLRAALEAKPMPESIAAQKIAAAP